MLGNEGIGGFVEFKPLGSGQPGCLAFILA
jgi:hypothetical protein